MAKLTQSQIGSRIRMIRSDLGISQEDVAEKLGISRQAVGLIEKGCRKLDSIELCELADFFSMSVGDLLSPRFDHPDSASKSFPDHDINLDADKLRNLILYILKQCGGKPNIGETVLYKLLYFIDFDCFESTGKPVAGIRYVKLQFGPVPSRDDYKPIIDRMISNGELDLITHEYFGKPQKRYIALIEPQKDSFSQTELDIINGVLKKLSDMNAKDIKEYVHHDIPWKATADGDTISYQLVFQREFPFAQNNYMNLWHSASSADILDELGPMSDEEANYYKNLG